MTLTQVVEILGYLLAGVLAINNMRWRLKNLEDDQDEIKTLLKQQAGVFQSIEVNTIELKGIAKLTEKRLQILEDRKS